MPGKETTEQVSQKGPGRRASLAAMLAARCRGHGRCSELGTGQSPPLGRGLWSGFVRPIDKASAKVFNQKTPKYNPGKMHTLSE